MKEPITAIALNDPETLVEMALEGCFSKDALAALLPPDVSREYLHACSAIEKRFTEDCTAAGDPCLEGGCAVEGDVCLQPLLKHPVEFQRACGAAFARLFVFDAPTGATS